MNLDDVDPVALAEELSKLPPSHPLVSAARVGVEVSDARRAAIETSHDVAGGWQADGGADDARRMWQGRAETDGPDSRAAEKAEELTYPPDRPDQCLPAPDTATAVRWAREWAAEQAAQRDEEDQAAEEACARHAAEAASRDTARNGSAAGNTNDDYHADTREMTHV
jgi:hypothetical protein